MGIRYTPDELLQLKESPLAVRPTHLPPIEEWMGQPAETARNQIRPSTDRNKSHDPLADQTNRRPGVDRHISRSSANPEDIVLGPPKTAFASATSMGLRNAAKLFDAQDRTGFAKDTDAPRDRLHLRNKTGEFDGDRRDGRNNMRMRRGDDQDGEGWSMVKPRKSFGTEGAERFNGRMGVDRHRDVRGFRDREDRERPTRGFENFTRERERETDQELEGTPRRNGVGRGRDQSSWFKEKDNNEHTGAPRDRNSHGDKHADKNRGWREKDRDEKTEQRGFDRANERGDRGNRWQERDPEWMDEPAPEKKQSHTQEDFMKWKESMKAGSGKTPLAEGTPSKTETGNGGGDFFSFNEPKVQTPLVIDSGPDKFLGSLGGWSQSDQVSDPAITSKEGLVKAKTVGKASRFTSFFTPQEEQPQRRTTEPLPYQRPPQQSPQTDDDKDKEGFALLLQKLHSQKPPSQPTLPDMASLQLNTRPPPSSQDHSQISTPLHQPETPQQYRPDFKMEHRPSTQNSQHSLSDLLTQRQNALSQPSSQRPEAMLQELVGQRQNAMSQSSNRADANKNINSNKDFLMGLMRAAPDPMRSEQLVMRNAPPKQPTPADRQMQQMMEREREQQIAQMQAQQAQGRRDSHRPKEPPLPGFFEDPSIAAFQRHEHRPQPMSILQRPPGLDLQMPPGWAPSNAPLPPPQQRHIVPPPGLAGAPNRMPPGMPQIFPPGFPMGAFPPPDTMNGPPRNMPPPPPGFFPPPGFIPPMSGFPGGPPEMGFGGPFDGRGQPGQGQFRR